MTATMSWTARPERLRHLGPNWFAAVMGTGMLANAAATLPGLSHTLHRAAVALWVTAALALVGLATAWTAHHLRYPEQARAHRAHPVMTHFVGAVPMAPVTVAAGTLLLGPPILGATPAVVLAWLLWSVGTVLGLATAIAVPYRMFTGPGAAPDAAFGGWLMPVVPPMVSAAVGALLLPHTPAGQPRLTLLVLCCAMFGLSLIAASIVLVMIWSRLVHHGPPPSDTVATLWIALGPLGQSVTAAGLLADASRTVLPAGDVDDLIGLATVLGVAVWGFAMLWLTLAAAVTLRAARAGDLRFNLTWWGFTFPVGTCVTGSTVLFTHTGAYLFAVAAVLLYALLAAAWTVTAACTVRGLLDGTLPTALAAIPPPEIGGAREEIGRRAEAVTRAA